MKSISDVVSGAGLAVYAEIALVIFFVVFVVIGLRVLAAGKRSFREEALLPFADDPTDSANPSPAREAREVMHVER